MADDYNDKVSCFAQTSKDMIELQQRFANFTNQMSSHLQQLHSKIADTDERLWQSQASFKQEICDELDDLRSLLRSTSSTSVLDTAPDSSPDNPISGVMPGLNMTPSLMVSRSNSSSVGGSSSSAHFTDVQGQMMLMLTESFSKLTSIMGEQKSISDSKTDWPKFAGDAKKFRAWHLSIIAQISMPPWSEFYDASTHGVVLATQNTTLNSRLYAKLISVLEGQALQDMISRLHLCANGLLLLQDLIQTYKPVNVPEVLAAKAGELWSKMRRSFGESVDTYYNRFKELLDELDQADDKISTKSSMRHFIFTLGAEFESIQHNYRIGNLPQEWNTTDWPSLLVLCRNYYITVNPKGPILRDWDPNFENNHAQRMAQQKKVKEWFLNPGKFSKEVEQEQCKYPDKCIYHLTKSHTTLTLKIWASILAVRVKHNWNPFSIFLFLHSWYQWQMQIGALRKLLFLLLQLITSFYFSLNVCLLH
jgi:hypothetical protein